MNRFLSAVSRKLTRLLVATIVSWGFPVVALAQVAAASSESAKGYINQYAIAIFLAAMGLIIICMPSRRADDPPFKREF